MECLERQNWKTRDKEALNQLKIDRPDEQVRKQVQRNWDMVAKPLDGMGVFEQITCQIGAITGNSQVALEKKAVLVLCADNGVVEEGISQSGQEVTAAVAREMTQNLSSVGKMAATIGAEVFPIDIGINCPEEIPGMIQKCVRKGTRNFRKELAMTEEETLQAIFTGMDLVGEYKQKGYQILATGEMGIGNTTTSSAVIASLLQCEVESVTGRGAGLSDAGLRRKQQVITEAIKKYHLKEAEPLEVLRTVGGLDIAGLAGICIGGAVHHVPVVLDGVISFAAALVAERLVPGVKAYLISSHKGKEPAFQILQDEMDLHPVIDGRLALGEGTGAVMMFALLDMALSVYENKTTFADIEILPYERFQ